MQVIIMYKMSGTESSKEKHQTFNGGVEQGKRDND